jgi:hypothetical protein
MRRARRDSNPQPSHPKFEDRGFAAVRHYSRPPIFPGFSLAAVRLCPALFAWVGVRVGVNSVQMASGLAIRDALFSPVHGCSQLPQNAGFWSSPVHGRSLVATAVGVRVGVGHIVNQCWPGGTI